MSNFTLDIVLMDIDELNATQQPLMGMGLMIMIWLQVICNLYLIY